MYNCLLGLCGIKGGGLAIDVSSEPVFLSKKRRISMDVSSGLIFLTHTKIYIYISESQEEMVWHLKCKQVSSLNYHSSVNYHIDGIINFWGV